MDHILGRKIGMTQVFAANGSVVPVTVIQAGPCFVTALRTVAKDGYDGVQVAYEQAEAYHKPDRQRPARKRPGNQLSSPQYGYLKKRNLPALRQLKEFRENPVGAEVGQTVTVSIFAKGEYVDVSGRTKGKGFQGGVKRHGFSGGPKTHGQSDRHRAPGSIGSGTTPGRVFKGTRMAGHMGDVRHTVLNLQVVDIDEENNLLLIRGAVPGGDNGLVTVRRAVKKRNARK
jgi:large subunit ribosomal protein L3